jgi:hypothetical protein
VIHTIAAVSTRPTAQAPNSAIALPLAAVSVSGCGNIIVVTK